MSSRAADAARSTGSASPERLRALRAAAPRSPFVRVSLLLMAAGLVGVWLIGPLSIQSWDSGPRLGPAFESLFDARRLTNLERFADRLLPPRETGTLQWLGSLLWERGLPAAVTTAAVALFAAGLAALIATPLALLGATALGTTRPYDVYPTHTGPLRRAGWRLVRASARALATLLRAVPEYLLAFVLTVLGPGAWPAVLALGLHNAGILGRLGAETVEDAATAPATAARARGATRAQLATQVLWPQVRPRLLVYFFYRLESCLRDSVVLGMLGVATLGYMIQNDARARMRYDEMLVYLGLAVLLVLFAEAISHLVRRRLQQPQ